MDVEGGLGDMGVDPDNLLGDQDPEQECDEAPEEKPAKKPKTLGGIPELDPDALPSSVIQKYLTLNSKINTTMFCTADAGYLFIQPIFMPP